MEFQENILGLIGNTPLVQLNRLARDTESTSVCEDGEPESGLFSKRPDWRGND